jgi:hypothetical protein
MKKESIQPLQPTLTIRPFSIMPPNLRPPLWVSATELKRSAKRADTLSIMLWSIIDGFIYAPLGVWLLLAGFGVVSFSNNKKKNEEVLQKWSVVLKIGGLFIAIIGVVSISQGLGLILQQ